MKNILVTGGAGYIGSHTAVDLIESGYSVVIADALFNASPEIVARIAQITGTSVPLEQVDLADSAAVDALFSKYHFDGVIHFAAHKSVGDSVEQPLEYYRNNLDSLVYLLQAMVAYEVPCFIFSSSCSVYGNAEHIPVTELTPLQPAESPYAATKQMGERIVRDAVRAYPQLQAVLLRYFNPAGAHPSNLIGESPRNRANNLVPIICEVATGKRESMTVFGDEYDTRDGSCIRDYIHVCDLARAHTLCLHYLEAHRNESACETFNVGIGEGVTVLEAIAAFESVTGRSLDYTVGPTREGDVVAIYADYTRAAERLGWQPRYDIADIMRTAYDWASGPHSTF